MAEAAVLEPTKGPARGKKRPNQKTKPASRPRAGAKPDQIPRTVTFFARVAQIDKEDWGSRASMSLYRLEPIIDRLRGSEKKHIAKYEEPIDENRIKLDYGSGRYRLYLNFKMPGAHEGKELDAIEFDILDMNYPPKVPYGEWVDDQRNRKWAWAKPPDPNAQKQTIADGAGTVLESFRVFTDIQDSVAARQAPAAPPQNPVSQLREAAAALKEFAPQAPAPTPPATDNAILNTVVTLFTKQLDTQAEQIKELRQELRDQHNKQPANSGLGTVTELVSGLGTLLPKLKEVFPNLSDTVTGRSRMSGWMEFVQPALPQMFEFLKPVGFALGQSLLGNKPGMQPPANGTLAAGATQGSAGAPTNQPPAIVQFLNVVTPAMLRHLNEWLKDPSNEAYSGKGFASSIDDLFGEKWNGLDWHAEARTAGLPAMQPVDAIVAVYQQAPKLWERLAPVEQQFRAFVRDFLEWTRPADLEADQNEVVDLTPVM
jgi:hypothetical protein